MVVTSLPKHEPSATMAAAGYQLCGPRAARRYLILVNMVIAFAALLYIVVGAISLAHGAPSETAPREGTMPRPDQTAAKLTRVPSRGGRRGLQEGGQRVLRGRVRKDLLPIAQLLRIAAGVRLLKAYHVDARLFLRAGVRADSSGGL